MGSTIFLLIVINVIGIKVIRNQGIKAGRAFAKRPGGTPLENTPSITQAVDSNARASSVVRGSKR